MEKNKKTLINENQFDLFSGTQNEIKPSISYTEEQGKFIFDESKDSIILASCAGSGKSFSCIQKLKILIDRGVDPNKIIFFSFTTDAIKELTKRAKLSGINVRDTISKGDGVTITTIHSFANSLLARMQMFKKIASFYEFIDWYKIENKPSVHATREQKDMFYELTDNMYKDYQQISSAIGAFKLQAADNIKSPLPPFMFEYNQFLRTTKKRDFSDILIEVRDLLRENKWIKMFRDKYDYIFVDEYQDTSTIQLQILLALNAKYYYLIGDRNQSIFGYSGANCKKLEEMLHKRREVIEMSLSINFRSDIAIIENSNKYSSLKATAKSENEGRVNKRIMFRLEELIELLNQPGEVVVLARTNDVIKKMEQELLKRKVPMNYFNFIDDSDIKEFKSFQKGDISKLSTHTIAKLSNFKGHFENDAQVISFIERFKTSKKFITSIHKSKGREFDECVVINSISPETLNECGIYDKLGKKRLERVSFTDSESDEESKNIHYVAISRSKHRLHFMIYE